MVLIILRILKGRFPESCVTASPCLVARRLARAAADRGGTATSQQQLAKCGSHGPTRGKIVKVVCPYDEFGPAAGYLVLSSGSYVHVMHVGVESNLEWLYGYELKGANDIHANKPSPAKCLEYQTVAENVTSSGYTGASANVVPLPGLDISPGSDLVCNAIHKSKFCR